MQLKHFLLWLPMIGIAFGNAALREWFFVKHFPDLRAHQLSRPCEGTSCKRSVPAGGMPRVKYAPSAKGKETSSVLARKGPTAASG